MERSEQSGTEGPGTARLRALPSWLLNQAAITANRLTDRALLSAGARRYHFAMLAALEEFGPMSQASLGRRAHLDRKDVAETVNELVAQGHVRREPDPADGRRNIITLTQAGAERLERLAALVDEAQESLLRSCSRQTRAALLAGLTQIIDAPDARSTPGSRDFIDG